MDLQTAQLQAAVSDLLRVNNLQNLAAYGHGGSRSDDATISPSHIVTESTMAMTRENSQAPESGEQELVSAPMRSLYEITKLRNIRSSMKSETRPMGSNMEDDFVSRGILPIDRAEELFGFFDQTMNQYLWGGIALKHDNLNSIRSSSSLLSAAVLTVSALHVPGKDEIFNTCYNEFVTVVSNSMLNRYHSLDEIRGLCIGAFWLSDLSWKLSGHAVRIATEINLH